jgi:hypothetical protein
MKLINKYLLIPLLLIVLQNAVFAQDSLAIDTLRINTTEIGFELNLVAESTLNNAMHNASGFIDNNLKDENLDRLGSMNRGGSFGDMRLFYRANRAELWGSKRLGYYFALEWHSIDAYQFTDDLYKLVLYGNKDFVGQDADLSNVGRYRLDYMQIKAGLHRKSENANHDFGVNVGLNLGKKFIGYQFNNPSYINTAADGTSITLVSNLNYFESDTADINWYQMSGMGAALDLFYKYSQERYDLSVSIENIGFIRWNSNALGFSENVEHTYIGNEVDNIFDMSESSSISNDTLEKYIYANTAEGAEYMPTPMDMKLRYNYYFNKARIKLSALAFVRLFSYMRPLYELSASYLLSNRFQLGPIVSYGGYTKFNAGLKLQFNVQRFQIKLESRYLTGFAQHSFSGMGGFINFTYKL